MARYTRASASHVNSSGTETANTRTVKTRRSHTKSRNGCTECKNRHIRCDERRPSCANCEVAERTCSFPPPKASKQKQRLRNERREKQKQLHQKSSPASVPTPLTHCHPSLTDVLDTVSEAVFMPQHMILLRYADTVPNFTRPDGSIVEIAIHRAVDSPYLIDEVLAFTALYLAHVYPGSAVQLQKLATELQTRALTTFSSLTETIPKEDMTTAVPRFLFSAILGRHILADTLAHHRSDFRLFIDRFVECFNLNRGIRAVTPPARDYLYNSEIQFLIRVIIEAQNNVTSSGNECEPLRRLMDDSDLKEASVEACRQAINVLQQSFDTCRSLNEDDYPQASSGFLVGVGAEFVDVLSKHRPEALVILAYYGVLLHRCRGFWAFGNAGASMIRAISGNLGSYWQETLAWPLYVLEKERVSELVDSTTPG